MDLSEIERILKLLCKEANLCEKCKSGFYRVSGCAGASPMCNSCGAYITSASASVPVPVPKLAASIDDQTFWGKLFEENAD